MKIAVCVKQVPDAGAPKRIDPQTKRLDRSVEGALNPFDVHAVEEALRVKEAAGDGEVVLVTLGPAKALESLRRASFEPSAIALETAGFEWYSFFPLFMATPWLQVPFAVFPKPHIVVGVRSTD